MIDNSKANFIQINPRNGETTHVDAMDISRPSVLILGGGKTNTCTEALNYSRSISRTLFNVDLHDKVNLYAVYYKFCNREASLDRLKLFQDVQDRHDMVSYSMQMSYPLYNTQPQYINDIFRFAFHPRLYGACGTPLSANKIKQNLRNMVIFTHCHGTYVLRMLEQQMNDGPIGMSMSANKLRELQGNVLSINHAPFAPLENCSFKLISFCSTSDDQINYYNDFYTALRDEGDKLPLAFYGEKFGNIMIANRLKKDTIYEHSPIGISGCNDSKLTPQGQVLFAAERNALIMGVDAMLNHKEIPHIPDMLNNEYVSYKELHQRGIQICKRLNIRMR